MREACVCHVYGVDRFSVGMYWVCRVVSLAMGGLGVGSESRRSAVATSRDLHPSAGPKARHK